ncbi:MAG TPA: S1-like domain-containing RNA-binding protein [Bacillota bacterium]|jgi:predicted RNA-binding protein (virulence factor B family)|nr:S1-like domain-containing RNA-binding protein [Bacillota bacterium]HOL09930.1 S1-like domain-containing RNA-binding protein [Bacillota bacterium]HPO96796.1 S1-like domain-containing RNA-binding protein [Bacillota bacterium]
MIALGKIQELIVVRKTPIGLYLNIGTGGNDSAVLLPKNQVSPGMEIGDKITVFVYKDSEDRVIATVNQPKLTVGELALLTVVDTTKIGAFLDWGLEKDLFLPFKEQLGRVQKGNSYLVGLYIDQSDRLAATMKIYKMLSCDSPYKVNSRVQGTIYQINRELGAFVAVANKYHGLIPNQELYGVYQEGDRVTARIKKVRTDGKLELSLRENTVNQIEIDARKIMEHLALNNGTLLLNDSSHPNQIKAELKMSKAAFKRAVGRLLKEGAIKLTDNGIERMW